IGAFEYQSPQTVTELTPSLTSAEAGQPVAVTMTVGGSDSGSNTPTGAVEFLVNGQRVATRPLAGGRAVCDFAPPLPAGYAVEARYLGDFQFDGSTSNVVRLTVTPDDDTTPPLIALGGASGTQTEGQDSFFTWDVIDASGLREVAVTVRQDGRDIYAVTTARGRFDFNAFGPGTFEIVVRATDNDNETANDALSGTADRRVVVLPRPPARQEIIARVVRVRVRQQVRVFDAASGREKFRLF